MNGANLQPRDIITLEAEIEEGREVKLRPALVISKNLLHQNSNGFLFLPITTNPIPSPFMMPMNESCVEAGTRLHKINESKIIIDKIIHAKHTEIRNKIGRVTPEFYRSITNKLKSDILEI